MARTLAMTTQQQVYIAGYDSSNQAVHHMVSPLPESEIKRQTLDKALQLAGSLQTTLDVDQIISLFSREIDSLVAHNSLAYRNEAQDISIEVGKGGRHTCTYRLVIRDKSYGELSLSRNKKFSTEELILLEYLLCSLVYPLRNAILYKQAVESAMKDPLTGAMNRASMDSSLAREVELAKRHDCPLSLIVLDIDHFKRVNDGYGHTIGDMVLKSITKNIESCIRSSDALFRYGGEEFVVVLNKTDSEGALLLAERIRSAVAKGIHKSEDRKLKVTASLGIATLNHGDDALELLKRADKALYQAKQSGRNCVCLAANDKPVKTAAIKPSAVN